MPTKVRLAWWTLIVSFLVFSAALLVDQSQNVALVLAVVALFAGRFWARRAAGVLVRPADAVPVHGDRMD